VLCELHPGGFAGEISAAKATKMLSELRVSGPVAVARMELGTVLVHDIDRLDHQITVTKRHLAAAVKESESSTTEIYGVGPIVAATVLGYTGDVARFPTRDRFAAYNGTAPIEVSSGPNKVFRLSLRGNRQMNHAIHMAAVTQIRHRQSVGRAYYDRKIAEGMAHKSALRALKRRISDALYARMVADARGRSTKQAGDPGGQSGNDSVSNVAGSHPEHRLFGLATPGPNPSLRRPPRGAPRKRAATPAPRTRKVS